MKNTVLIWLVLELCKLIHNMHTSGQIEKLSILLTLTVDEQLGLSCLSRGATKTYTAVFCAANEFRALIYEQPIA